MSHLHIPDGVLPPWAWGAGLAVALLVLLRASRLARDLSPQCIAYQGALGALMLATMAIPLGPFEYHLTLAGPMGVLLGGAGAFQVAFVVSVILALMGHGGLTVVGLNALLLGASATLAHRTFVAVPWLKPATALALATAVGQAFAGVLWLGLVTWAMRLGVARAPGGEAAHLLPVAAVGVPLWLLGVVAESVVAFGIGRFLGRVRPELLRREAPVAAPAEAGGRAA